MSSLPHSYPSNPGRVEAIVETNDPHSIGSQQSRLCTLLNRVQSEISSASGPSGIHLAVDQLFKGLRIIRNDVSAVQWKQLIAYGRQHTICRLVHQDPFTSRAFHKPRGYAGDAVMMDYIYGREEGWPRPQAGREGSAIFEYTTGAPASAGVRERRCFISELLNSHGRDATKRQVLSIACGHLREASLSSAVRRKRFQRFVALDADPLSLKEVATSYGRFGIEPVQANVRKMLAGRLGLGSFDLIYSTGLYDYLNDSLATRLTANLFRHVRTGGRLVIANFLPNIRDVGYMEMFMDWHLVYRSRGGMLALADEIDESQVREIRIIAEDNDNIVFLEVTKR